MKIVYLDIETKKLLCEFPKLRNGKDDRTYIKDLGIAVAGTLCGDNYRTFEDGQLLDLIDHLKRFDLIVGYNILWFDYKVLGGYFQFPEAVLGTSQAGIISKTFDTMNQFSQAVANVKHCMPKDVSWVSLDDIAQRNFGMGKPHDGKLIPGMWKQGKHDEVKTYLLNDLKMTEKLYLAGCTGTLIKYESKNYGKSEGEKEIFLKW